MTCVSLKDVAMRWALRARLVVASVLLSACNMAVPTAGPETQPGSQGKPRAPIVAPAGHEDYFEERARNFVTVVKRVEPIAEAQCARVGLVKNCDFLIVVDDTPGAPPNAFQTVNSQGRPVIAFTAALIAQSRNADELAFVMSHEAAHHILGHIGRARRNASVGAETLARLAGAAGASDEVIKQAARVGAAVGSRSYSKDYELEADELGTIITYVSGFDPEKGVAFFQTVPDPGNRFLGTHPPNSRRIARVSQTIQRIKARQ